MGDYQMAVPEIVVPIKSAWVSKINVTQAVTLVSVLLATFGINMPEDVRVGILTIIGAVGPIVTWVLRTWYTKSVTKSSV